MDLSESETGSEEDVTGKPVACTTAAEKPNASSKSDCQEKNGHTIYTCLQPQFLTRMQSSRCGPQRGPGREATVRHMEAVFSIIRKIYGREHDDPMNDLEVNMATWAYF